MLQTAFPTANNLLSDFISWNSPMVAWTLVGKPRAGNNLSLNIFVSTYNYALVKPLMRKFIRKKTKMPLSQKVR